MISYKCNLSELLTGQYIILFGRLIMDIWNLFCETGSIDAYILYCLSENDFEETAEGYNNEQL